MILIQAWALTVEADIRISAATSDTSDFFICRSRRVRGLVLLHGVGLNTATSVDLQAVIERPDPKDSLESVPPLVSLMPRDSISAFRTATPAPDQFWLAQLWPWLWLYLLQQDPGSVFPVRARSQAVVIPTAPRDTPQTSKAMSIGLCETRS